VAARIGIERDVAPRPGVTMRLRGGAFFEPSPAPEQTRAANLYDNARAALSLGYGLALAAPLPPITMDLFAQLQLLVPRTHEKVAASSGGGMSSVRASGLLVAGGAALGVAF
jgi:long-chain fatty acid transport protein